MIGKVASSDIHQFFKTLGGSANQHNVIGEEDRGNVGAPEVKATT